MRIQINESLFQTNVGVDEDLYNQLLEFIPQVTEAIPDNIRVLVKGVIRSVLAFAEIQHPEMKEQLRPPKGVDPLVHCLKIMQGYILSKANNVTICFDATDEWGKPRSINAITLQLSFEGEGW